MSIKRSNQSATKARRAVGPRKPDPVNLLNRLAAIGACIAAVIIAVMFVAQPLSAQSGTGSIQGTVTDPNGAVIAGATVQATNVGTGQITAMKTTGAGLYVLPALQPGEYKVEFKAPGFAPVRHEHIKVEPITVTGLNVTLAVGGATAEVVVTSAPPALNTESGTLDAVLPSEAYSALPVAMNQGPKTPSAFTGLLPQTNNSTAIGTWDFAGGIQGTGNSYVNGVQVTNDNTGGAMNSDNALTTEGVQEFQVITSGVPAQYNGQGISNVVLKSGSNALHGDVYENVRNTMFDGLPYTGTVQPDHENEYGASVGGPILKNRLFFFGNYDRFRYTGVPNQATYTTVPTAKERTGDFSELLTEAPVDQSTGRSIKIYDPTTTSCSGGVCTRQQFNYNGQPNVIPPGRISPISQYFESFLPAPTNGGLNNNFLMPPPPNGTQRISYLGKLDYQLNNNNHIYALMSTGQEKNLAASGSGLPFPYSFDSQSGGSEWVNQLGETWTIKPNLVNSFTLAYDRSTSGSRNLTDGSKYVTTSGLLGVPAGVTQNNWPQLEFGGANNPTSWGATSSQDQIVTMDNYVLQDTLEWVKGKHALNMGYVFAYQEYLYNIASDIDVRFQNLETAGYCEASVGGPQYPGCTGYDSAQGNSYASYMLGLVDYASIRDQYVPETNGRTHQWTLFVQDDWKPMPKLTVNLGLRYTAWLPYTESRNHQSWTSETAINPLLGIPGAQQFAGSGTSANCNCATLDKIWYSAGFDPRFGLAYSLNSKTVLRGTFTINHFFGGSLGGSNQYQGTNLGGYNSNPTWVSSDSGIDSAFDWANGFPGYTPPPFIDATYGTSYTTLNGINDGNQQYQFDNVPDQAARPPYAENWSLTIERSLSPSVVWNASYTGNESHHIATFGGVGAASGMMNPKYLALGSLLTAQTTDANWQSELAQAQSVFSEIKLPYPSFYGPLYQMLKPFPQYGWVDDRLAEGNNGVYHSFTTSLTKRMSNGLYLLASYTWSKNIDDGAGTIPYLTLFDGAVHDAYNIRSMRSVSASDQPNVVKAAWVYTLPIGKGHAIGGQNNLTNAILGGWQVAGDNTYAGGTPILAIAGGNCNLPGFYPGVYSCYADYNPSFHGSARINGRYHGDILHTQWLNPAAFQDSAPFTFGNIPRSVPYKGFRMPGSANEDVNFSKDFQVSGRFERAKLHLQWDVFNLFNRTQMGGMNTDIDSSTFGYLSGPVNAVRKMQGEAYIRF